MLDVLCDECAEHFAQLQECLKASGIPYQVDSRIVRGLDYYTKTVFELITTTDKGNLTVCGGGRYDGLVQQLGGPALPGIGFGMGITRLLMAMEQSGAYIPEPKRPMLYIASLGERACVEANSITSSLRRDGVAAECDVMGRSLKAQMKYADKLGAHYVLILGDTEIDSGKAVIKDMKNSSQSEIDIASIIDFIKKNNG